MPSETFSLYITQFAESNESKSNFGIVTSVTHNRFAILNALGFWNWFRCCAAWRSWTSGKPVWRRRCHSNPPSTPSRQSSLPGRVCDLFFFLRDFENTHAEFMSTFATETITIPTKSYVLVDFSELRPRSTLANSEFCTWYKRVPKTALIGLLTT